jgi:hypothetical protein
MQDEIGGQSSIQLGFGSISAQTSQATRTRRVYSLAVVGQYPHTEQYGVGRVAGM